MAPAPHDDADARGSRLKRRISRITFLTAAALVIFGCAPKQQNTAERSAAAQTLFDSTTKNLHIPSAAATGAERLRLQNEAAAQYADLTKRFPEQSNLCAQALRGIGNIRAAQTNINDAVKHYAAVGDRYPGQSWEVLQAWKSAADLLWDAGRTNDARQFYSRIAARFDAADEPAIVKTVVRGSKARLLQ